MCSSDLEVTGYLQLPEGTNKVPIVIWTHGSGGPGEYLWSDFTYHGTQNLLKAGISFKDLEKTFVFSKSLGKKSSLNGLLQRHLNENRATKPVKQNYKVVKKNLKGNIN